MAIQQGECPAIAVSNVFNCARKSGSLEELVPKPYCASDARSFLLLHRPDHAVPVVHGNFLNGQLFVGMNPKFRMNPKFPVSGRYTDAGETSNFLAAREWFGLGETVVLSPLIYVLRRPAWDDVGCRSTQGPKETSFQHLAMPAKELGVGTGDFHPTPRVALEAGRRSSPRQENVESTNDCVSVAIPVTVCVMGWSWEINPGLVEMASSCWRPLCPYRHSVPSWAARWAGVWSTLAALEETPETGVVADGVEGVSGVRVRQLTAEQIGSAPQFREKTVDDELPEQFFEMLEPERRVQLVEVPKFVVGLAVSSGEGGSSGPGKRDTTDEAAAVVEVPVGEARPPGISQYSTATESEFEGSGPGQVTQLALTMHQLQKLLVKLGLPSLRRTLPRQNPRSQYRLVNPRGPGAKGTPTADITAVAMLAGEARPFGIEKSAAPGQNPSSQSSQSLLMKLGPLVPEQPARPVPTLQQSQCLLMKLGLTGISAWHSRRVPGISVVPQCP